jgi:uncharacterized protein YecE (DUF72 family)
MKLGLASRHLFGRVGRRDPQPAGGFASRGKRLDRELPDVSSRRRGAVRLEIESLGRRPGASRQHGTAWAFHSEKQETRSRPTRLDRHGPGVFDGKRQNERGLAPVGDGNRVLPRRRVGGCDPAGDDENEGPRSESHRGEYNARLRRSQNIPSLAYSLRAGTSSWSSNDWRGALYPERADAASFLGHYATHFDTVECDATFYRIPSAKTVEGWRDRTPPGFLFTAKLPQEITHEKGLLDCATPLREFLAVMERLGDKLGPILAQFAYVAKGKDANEYATGASFCERLASFLALWPRERKLAVEVRNATWIAPRLLELLRERGIALALSAYYTMPAPEKLFAGPDPRTADFSYVRFIGDHKKMDALVAKLKNEGKRAGDWSEIAVDRTAEMKRWAAALKSHARGPVLAYFNNHYAGFAPDSARLFRELWDQTPT